jgi:hypothetical protein
MGRCFALSIPFFHARRRSLGGKWILQAPVLTIMGPMTVPARHCRSTSTDNTSCIILHPPHSLNSVTTVFNGSRAVHFPARQIATNSFNTSVSTSFQLPTHKQRPTEHSAVATDVWYFCRPQNSPTRPVKWPAPSQDQLLTRRPKSKYISCTLCS